MRRPLGFVALLYGGGILLGEFVQPPLSWLFVFSLGLAGAALGSAGLRRHLIWPLIVVTGWTNLVWRTAVISPCDLRVVQGEAVELASVRGELIASPALRRYLRDGRESWRTLAQVQLHALRKDTGWQPVSGRIEVSTAGVLPGAFFAGQTVEITGILAPPPGSLAPGLFDYRAWLRRQEIYCLLKAESSNDWRLVAPVAVTPPLSDRFRTWARAALARGLPGEDESLRLEWALSLGDKAVLTEAVAEPFVRAATFHIFAVDGLRLAIFFGIFFTVLRALRLPRAFGGGLLIPAIWLYTALTGWPASAIRASLMLTIVVVGWVLKRPSELLNSLFATALIILAADPQQLFQAGFQLSFVVVLCLVVTLPVFDRFSKRLLQPDPLLPAELVPRWQQMARVPARYLLDLLLTSCAAWLGSIPLVACYFHVFTPVSTPANVVAVPLCALVLASNFISLSLAGWFPAAAVVFNHAGWFFMECIRVTSHWFAGWWGACFYVPAPGLFSIGLYYLLLLAAFTGWLFTAKWRLWKLAGLLALLSLWTAQWQRSYFTTHLTLLPLNGGSAVHCDAPGSRNDLLADCGNAQAVEFVVKPFLRAQGVNRLPCLALTHGDLRQVGGADSLLALLPIEQVATSFVRFRSPAYRSLVARLETTPERWRRLNRGDQMNGWTVLHPDRADHFAQADDNALVLFGNFEGTRVLLLSDLGKTGQDTLRERVRDLKADIVVGGMPQQGEPLESALLDAIRPRLIVVTDSEFPVTRRAGAALCERLDQRGIPVLYTRSAGAVTISLRRNQWAADTMSGGHWSGVSGSDP